MFAFDHLEHDCNYFVSNLADNLALRIVLKVGISFSLFMPSIGGYHAVFVCYCYSLDLDQVESCLRIIDLLREVVISSDHDVLFAFLSYYSWLYLNSFVSSIDPIWLSSLDFHHLKAQKRPFKIMIALLTIEYLSALSLSY